MGNQQNAADLLSKFVLPERLARFKAVAALRTKTLTIVLDALHHEHNISAVIRSADAFGLQGIHLVGNDLTVSPGITTGSHERLEVTTHEHARDAVCHLKAAGYKLVICEPPSREGNCLRQRPLGTQRKYTLIPVYQLPFNEQLALVFGNERYGVNQLFSEAADFATFIPMFGFVESLNVSVAAAICLFCSTFSPGNGTRQVETLDKMEQQLLIERWLRADVRGAEQILKA